jgi:hypothetical protein
VLIAAMQHLFFEYPHVLMQFDPGVAVADTARIALV